MNIQSILAVSFVLLLFQVSPIHARTFYNAEGKSIEAEMISVKGDTAVMKTTNGRQVEWAIKKLSISDQDYIKTWWKENKNRLFKGDVKFSIYPKKAYTKKPKPRIRGNSKIRSSESTTTFFCHLQNFSTKTVSGVKASYSVYKRVSKRGKGGTSSNVVLVNKSIKLGVLPSRKSLRFNTNPVKCSNSSVTPTYGSQGRNTRKVERSSHSETIIGVVITLTDGGREILSRSHPENLIRRLHEEERRADQKAIADNARAEAMDKGRESRDADDVKRSNLKRKEQKAREDRKRKEKEAREKNQKRYNDKKRRY